MWPSKTENAILKVERADAVYTDDGTHNWKLRRELYARPRELLHAEDIIISEPFGSDGYDEIAENLDPGLDNDLLGQYNAEDVSRKIDAFKKSLFEELKLGNHVGAFRGRCLDVHVWPNPSSARGPRSIHSMQW